jgi:hypothetical protein
VAALQNRHAAFGLWFLAIPATVVSIDRMTVDVALGALTACFAYQVVARREPALWLTLAAAGLVRETGLLLAAACVLAALVRRDLRRAALWATTALPALCWYGYLYLALPHSATASLALIPEYMIPRPQAGIVQRALDPPRYPLPPSLETVARVLDSVALVAMMAVAVIAVLRLRKPAPPPLRAALALHTGLLLLATEKTFWDTPFGYCRPFAPLFALLFAGSGHSPRRGAWIGVALASAFVDVRLATEIKAQVLGVIRWFL